MSEPTKTPSAVSTPAAAPKIPVAPPAKPSAPVAVASRRERGQDRSAIDPATQRADRHYHWFRRDRADMTSMRMKGYTPESINDEKGARPATDYETTAEGHIVMGDLILASCPKDLFDKSRSELHRLNEDQLGSTTADTEAQAAAKGVTIIRDKE